MFKQVTIDSLISLTSSLLPKLTFTGKVFVVNLVLFLYLLVCLLSLFKLQNVGVDDKALGQGQFAYMGFLPVETEDFNKRNAGVLTEGGRSGFAFVYKRNGDAVKKVKSTQWENKTKSSMYEVDKHVCTCRLCCLQLLL